MSKYIVSADTIRVANEASMDIRNTIPTGTYRTVMTDSGFMLKRTNEIGNVVHVYGPKAKYVNRVISTFESRESNTGVLCWGQQGSGKSLFCKTICRSVQDKYPVILMGILDINPGVIAGLQAIDTDCIIFMDELDKTNIDNQQPLLLSLLDGVNSKGKRLFLFTANEKLNINRYMMDRPGRIFYSFSFGAVDADSIRDYAGDKLVNKGFMADLIKTCLMSACCSFDLLVALVEDCNRYNEAPSGFINIMNRASAEYSNRLYRTTNICIEGVDYPCRLYNGVDTGYLIAGRNFRLLVGTIPTEKGVTFERQLKDMQVICFSVNPGYYDKPNNSSPVHKVDTVVVENKVILRHTGVIRDPRLVNSNDIGTADDDDADDTPTMYMTTNKPGIVDKFRNKTFIFDLELVQEC